MERVGREVAHTGSAPWAEGEGSERLCSSHCKLLQLLQSLRLIALHYILNRSVVFPRCADDSILPPMFCNPGEVSLRSHPRWRGSIYSCHSAIRCCFVHWNRSAAVDFRCGLACGLIHRTSLHCFRRFAGGAQQRTGQMPKGIKPVTTGPQFRYRFDGADRVRVWNTVWGSDSFEIVTAEQFSQISIWFLRFAIPLHAADDLD